MGAYHHVWLVDVVGAIPEDYDGDGIGNLDDPCPLTKNVPGGDYSDTEDNDTIGHDCDLAPATGTLTSATWTATDWQTDAITVPITSTRARKTYWKYAMAAGLAAVLAHCQCNHPPGASDADDDADADLDSDGNGDGDIDIDIDLDLEGDPDHGADAEPDRDEVLPERGTIEELCGDEGSAWTWHPFECPELDPPDDCCPSCRPVTCRVTANGGDIWANWVVYDVGPSVGMVDLDTGRDELVFPVIFEETRAFSFGQGAVGSRYVIARRTECFPDGNIGNSDIVARRLDDLEIPIIVVDDTPITDLQNPDVYNEWACWGRTPVSTGVWELVLYNIETGEHRVLDVESPGFNLYAVKIWGDRVVWTDSRARLREHRISTGETRTVLQDGLLGPMFSLSIWEHYVVFQSDPDLPPSQIYLLDLETGEHRRVSPSNAEQEFSFIHNGRIAWTDYRFTTGGPAGMHVFIYSMRTNREYVLNPSSRGGEHPEIFDRTIIWTGGPEGSGSIWVTRIADI